MPYVKIVVPSMSRAKTITTHRMLRECLVCIPESQVEEYAQTLPRSSLLPHPDSVRGLAPKLNWIYQAMRDEPAFMVMDDDVLYMARCFTNLGEKAKVEVSENEVTEAVLERARQFAGQERAVWDFYRKNPQALAELRAPIFEDKVVDHILATASVTDKTVSKDALMDEGEEEEASKTATAESRKAETAGAQ